MTGEINEMELDITEQQLSRWYGGELIQVVMPHLSATEREFLITGMTPEEQDEFYSKLEE